MIVVSLCNCCFQPYQILIETGDIALIKQISTEDGKRCPCPRLCGGMINLVGDPAITGEVRSRRLAPVMKLNGKELYRAVKGMGLPDELPVNSESVVAMLKSSNVVRVESQEWQTNLGTAIYLSEITLSNGVTIHLTAGLRGAQVLKMTKEKSNGAANQSFADDGRIPG